METLFKVIGIMISVFLLMFVIGFLTAFLVQYLWNILMPDIFGLQTITYWQSFGLYILTSILFKSANFNSK